MLDVCGAVHGVSSKAAFLPSISHHGTPSPRYGTDKKSNWSRTTRDMGTESAEDHSRMIETIASETPIVCVEASS
jgi:hypothetical protein